MRDTHAEVQAFTGKTLKNRQFEQAVAAIERLHADVRSERESQLLLMVGRAGVGKTSIVEHYVSNNPRTRYIEYDHIPVLKAQMPANPSMREIVDRLVRAIVQEPDSPELKGSRAELTNRLQKLIPEVGTELIIIDEAHHMLSKCANPRNKQGVADLLKELLITLNVPLLLVGLPELDELVTPEEYGGIAREQLISRSLRPIQIDPIPYKSKAWPKILEKYAEQLPVSAPSLTTKEMQKRMFIAARGVHREISKLLSEAIRSRARDDQISVEDLADSYEAVSTRRSGLSNPFRADTKQLNRDLEAVTGQ